MNIQLIRLLHLASPALPVGAFSYSQGLEWAVESGKVTSEAAAQQWIRDALHFALARCEAPALVGLMRAWKAGDVAGVARLNAEFTATRETAELRAETLQMGYSLARLLRDLPEIPDSVRETHAGLTEIAFPTAWAAAAAHWQIGEQDAASTYLWAWLENQVMAAVKLVPLGQTAGQRMLVALAPDLPALAQEAIRRAEEEAWENFTPGMTLASCLHETQYTRLFRS
ncbi:MAG: urease accessory protein UreF [Candidatus Dactylopiibacterium carminicum]|uniref:Urease accessory protein UreF n=1 Tax=Candidatus Dactylopiibacterium carminicum TaxID=857335 RepID=A0A272EXC4_9RHOO|nr:urease accessory protein UreF [Candidatus Dactylopiibacterium carminicum]KAF7600214.1 urease accessory protein UreF [Candidatus Dactylopiibacterium carminicum]PAS94768.1 MAG: urease accessory protein UreF [Candidatus Dactylopiibacterium carminicum]PAS97693.1 MAG: urease accessory protein UreF [Candidatus Dactylopiibacterium carminicum]PAT00210.1 MAG: urease accessory protein UreF [Candidatus Dactylopiibacterium carminicum]